MIAFLQCSRTQCYLTNSLSCLQRLHVGLTKQHDTARTFRRRSLRTAFSHSVGAGRSMKHYRLTCNIFDIWLTGTCAAYRAVLVSRRNRSSAAQALTNFHLVLGFCMLQTPRTNTDPTRQYESCRSERSDFFSTLSRTGSSFVSFESAQRAD